MGKGQNSRPEILKPPSFMPRLRLSGCLPAACPPTIAMGKENTASPGFPIILLESKASGSPLLPWQLVHPGRDFHTVLVEVGC